MVRKLSMPFFFLGGFELFVVEPLEEEARLVVDRVDVLLLESDEEGRCAVLVDETEVQGWMSKVSLMLVPVTVSGREMEESLGGSWFR